MYKKISPQELRIGMNVCGMERQPGKPVFFMNNIILKTRADVEKMNNNGTSFVYVTTDNGSAACPSPEIIEKTAEPAEEAQLSLPYPEPEPALIEEVPEAAGMAGEKPTGDSARSEVVHPAEEVSASPAIAAPVETRFEEEVKEAKRVRGEAEQLVKEFLHNARLGREVDAERVTGTVGRMVDSVFRNQDALTSLARLKSYDDYTFAHSVNVCILSLAIGRHLGLDRSTLADLGTGAILHDIGKMLVPGHLLNKPGKFTDDEFALMKRHTELGGEFLKGARINEVSILVALQHHERLDGNGYCSKLAGEDIHLFARIAAVADAYDAMTSERVYQRGMAPEDALKRLYTMRGKYFEPHLVERLIKCLGIYPIGSLVELNTGELAVVKMINRSHPLQPTIEIITDARKNPCEKTFETDLRDEAGRWIAASHRPEEFAQLSRLLAS